MGPKFIVKDIEFDPIQKIYFDLNKFACQASQTAEWHFICNNEEIILSGKKLFEILKRLTVSDALEDGNG